MKNTSILLLFMTFIGLCIVQGCSDDEKIDYAIFSLKSSIPEIKDDTIFLVAETSVITFNIESTINCSAAYPKWIERAETSAVKDNKLIVKFIVSPNSSEFHRNSYIELRSAGSEKIIKVNIRQSPYVDEEEEDERVVLFEENFDDNSLDAAKWSNEPSGGSAWNYYVTNEPEHVEVKYGNLYLRATWDATTETPKTGAVSTIDKFSFNEGEIEVRAKFTSTGQGSWPAIWLMPQTPLVSGWPDCGEIDIMERLNNDEFIYTTIHMNATHKPSENTIKPIFVANEYNVYGMKKWSNKLEFYLNGEKTLTIEKPASATESVEWPFDTDFYLILNQACSDNGASGMSFWPGLVGDDVSMFPYEMAVDWVRIYELAEE